MRLSEQKSVIGPTDPSKSIFIAKTFNLKYDTCSYKQVLSESVGPGEYQLNMPFVACDDCFSKDPQLILQRSGVSVAKNIPMVDVDSELRNNRKGLTNLNCIQNLNTRPYTTVPYMGRGVGDVKNELDIKQGKQTWVSRSCNTLSDMDYTDYHMIPLLDDLRNNIQNPNNLVQENASQDWVRGGIPSRQLVRNKEFLESCGYKEDGNAWVNPKNTGKLN